MTCKGGNNYLLPSIEYISLNANVTILGCCVTVINYTIALAISYLRYTLLYNGKNISDVTIAIAKKTNNCNYLTNVHSDTPQPESYDS